MSKKPRYVYDWDEERPVLSNVVTGVDFSAGIDPRMLSVAEHALKHTKEGSFKGLAVVAVTDYGKWTAWTAGQTNQELLICYLDALKFEIHVNQSKRDPDHLLTSWVDYGE